MANEIKTTVDIVANLAPILTRFSPRGNEFQNGNRCRFLESLDELQR